MKQSDAANTAKVIILFIVYAIGAITVSEILHRLILSTYYSLAFGSTELYDANDATWLQQSIGVIMLIVGPVWIADLTKHE